MGVSFGRDFPHPFEDLKPEEQRFLRSVPGRLNEFERRQLIRKRRLALLAPNVPVRLKTTAYVLMTSPERVRRLVDDGHLRGSYVYSRRWEFSVADIGRVIAMAVLP